VRSDKEQGNINTPMELAIPNQIDSFSLVIDAIDRVPALRDAGAHVKERMKDRMLACRRFAYAEGFELARDRRLAVARGMNPPRRSSKAPDPIHTNHPGPAPMPIAMPYVKRCPRACLLALLTLLSLPAAARCPGDGPAVQVLGSGGPVADDGRASSGYLLWLEGRSRLLVDAGGGTFLRFGEAGGAMEDLDRIAITHLHTDHVADLPALLKGGYFSDRSRPLPLLGPTGNRLFPAMDAFVTGLFDPEQGVFRYLGGFLDGSDGLFATPVTVIDARPGRLTELPTVRGVRLAALGVHHGPVPALAYRVDVGGRRVVFSGDLSADTPDLAEFVQGADLLVMDHAIPGSAGRIARNLHATPERIGTLAAQARVKTLLLSHLMARSLADPRRNLAQIREHFDGRIAVAEDLMCLSLADRP
jgi:ribonuclease BN (tRNA processing enzyme)